MYITFVTHVSLNTEIYLSASECLKIIIFPFIFEIIYSLSFFPPNSYTPHCFLSNSQPLSLNFYMQICICITYTPSSILLSLYNVTQIYVFGADHLVLDNQLVCASLGKTYFSNFQHSLVACTSLCRTEDLCPFSPRPTPNISNMPLFSLFSSCLGSHISETLWW